MTKKPFSGPDTGFITPPDIYFALENYRFAWLSGRVRSGKTAFAYKLAEYWLKRGWYLFENVGSQWGDNPAKILERARRFITIMDEGGIYLTPTQVKRFKAGLGKLESFFISASAEEPPRSLQGFRIERYMNGYSVMGLPFWLYRYQQPGQKDWDWFFWVHPRRMFGVFDTLTFVQDDAGYTAIINKILDKAGPGRRAPVSDWGLSDLAEEIRSARDE